MADFGRGAGGQFNSKFTLGRLGFGVGIPTFLDSEASRVRLYYRGLEFGSEKFLGREIYGVFGRGSRYDYQGGGFYAPGSGEGQQFFPLRYAAGLIGGGGTPTAKVLRYLRQAGRTGEKGSRSYVRGSNVVATIKNAIIAQNAYKDAFKSFGAAEKEKAAVLQILGGLIGPVDARGAGGRGGVVVNTTPLVDLRTQRKAPLTSRQFRSRGGFLTGGALSGYTGSLAGLDRTLQRELTQINKLLAEGLSVEVAALQRDRIKRPGTESGRLLQATTDVRNRYPT